MPGSSLTLIQRRTALRSGANQTGITLDSLDALECIHDFSFWRDASEWASSALRGHSRIEASESNRRYPAIGIRD
jgi:hypothetical protein